jgi:hypothetical protein
VLTLEYASSEVKRVNTAGDVELQRSPRAGARRELTDDEMLFVLVVEGDLGFFVEHQGSYEAE